MKKNLGRKAVVAALTASMAVLPVVPAFAKSGENVSLDPATVGNVRIWGTTRGATSVSALNSAKADPYASATELFVVSGAEGKYADALSLTTLSDAVNAPVLVTDTADVVSSDVLSKITSYLKSHSAIKYVTIVGGTQSVSAKAEAAINLAVAGAKTSARVTRIAGDTRYETARLLAAYTIGSYTSTYEALRNLRVALVDAETAAPTYEAAKQKFEAASAELLNQFAKTREVNANLTAAQKAEKDKIDQLKQDVTGTAASAKESLDKVTAEVAAANTKRDNAQALLEEFTKTLDPALQDKKITEETTVSAAMSTLTDNEAATKLLIKAKTVEGISDTSKISELKTKLEALKATAENLANSKSDELVAANKNYQAILASVESNAQILKDLASLIAKREAAQKAAESQAEAEKHAQKQRDDAAEALKKAVTSVSQDVVAAQKKLDDAIDSKFTGYKSAIFLADGENYPDALVAGPAAAEKDGIILLTQGASLPSTTTTVLDTASKSNIYTVGTPATKALPKSYVTRRTAAYAGETRYDTAAAVDADIFGDTKPMAVASGEHFADAVIASSYIAQYDGGVLLTRKSDVPVATRDYLQNKSDRTKSVRVFGGTNRIDDATVSTIVAYNGGDQRSPESN